MRQRSPPLPRVSFWSPGPDKRSAAAELARQRVRAAGGRILGGVLNDPDGLVSRMAAGYYTYDYPAAVD
jgi:hypothetical protein